METTSASEPILYTESSTQPEQSHILSRLARTRAGRFGLSLVALASFAAGASSCDELPYQAQPDKTVIAGDSTLVQAFYPDTYPDASQENILVTGEDAPENLTIKFVQNHPEQSTVYPGRRIRDVLRVVKEEKPEIAVSFTTPNDSIDFWEGDGWTNDDLDDYKEVRDAMDDDSCFAFSIMGKPEGFSEAYPGWSAQIDEMRLDLINWAITEPNVVAIDLQPIADQQPTVFGWDRFHLLPEWGQTTEPTAASVWRKAVYAGIQACSDILSPPQVTSTTTEAPSTTSTLLDPTTSTTFLEATTTTTEVPPETTTTSTTELPPESTTTTTEPLPLAASAVPV